MPLFSWIMYIIAFISVVMLLHAAVRLRSIGRRDARAALQLDDWTDRRLFWLDQLDKAGNDVERTIAQENLAFLDETEPPREETPAQPAKPQRAVLVPAQRETSLYWDEMFKLISKKESFFRYGVSGRCQECKKKDILLHDLCFKCAIKIVSDARKRMAENKASLGASQGIKRYSCKKCGARPAEKRLPKVVIDADKFWEIGIYATCTCCRKERHLIKGICYWCAVYADDFI